MIALLFASWTTQVSNSQFLTTWLDIGEMQSRYAETGALPERSLALQSLEWPAILRGSGHYRAKSYWIGLKDWTDETGRAWDYRVAQIGPRADGFLFFTAVETRLIAKYEDTEVIVNGGRSFDKIALVDDVDPNLPADRVLYQKYRSILGVETERWVYAYAHEIHDDYHIIRRRMINNGNSDGMTTYPIVEPPRPPRRFEVISNPDHVELQWEAMPASPDPVEWEIYRTSGYTDNLPYELIARLPGAARSYDDWDLIRGVDYYYFIQAVGPPNPVDELGLTGTPGGLPLKSGRYFTQTYNPASFLRIPGKQVSDFRIVPNPINLASDESVRVILNGDPTRSQMELLDIPGKSTISIYTEIGELVKRIEHTDGSGNTTWNLTTTSRQPIVSGIYIVHVADNESGEVDIKKLVVVR